MPWPSLLPLTKSPSYTNRKGPPGFAGYIPVWRQCSAGTVPYHCNRAVQAMCMPHAAESACILPQPVVCSCCQCGTMIHHDGPCRPCVAHTSRVCHQADHITAGCAEHGTPMLRGTCCRTTLGALCTRASHAGQYGATPLHLGTCKRHCLAEVLIHVPVSWWFW